MKSTEFKQLIRESIQEYIREIDNKGNEAAVRAKMEACEEAIASRNKKIEMSESLEEMKDMVDPTKIKTLRSEIKVLEKSKNKYKKQLDKLEGKSSSTTEGSEEKEVVTEEEPVVEADIEMNEEGSTDEVNEVEETIEEVTEETPINESFIRMQKLAGVITENK